uniref:Endosome-associated-trafficking regulator 1 n=1 Tax=Culex tarsalis TaxID=7177 RepID=A0A1Q3FWQ3_CULTA
MAKDNNNINITDELASGGGGAGSSSSSAEALKQQNRLISGEPDLNGRINGQLGAGHSSAPEGTSESGASLSSQHREADGVGAIHELPRREENPFSFKHFLKRDSSLGAGASSTNASASAANINHSRSASSINGGTSAGNGVATVTTCTATISSSQPSTSGASPSKSATTSSLHNSTSTTGAKPKIPQFQSVNTLSSESKMKRSPRFPSFDSQSSLSDLADDKFMAANIYHSRSNNSSFSSDYPLGGAGSGVGGGSGGVGGGSQQYVQRSYSNYDMESPGSVESPRLVGSQNLHNSPNFGGGGGGGGRSRENLAAGHRLGASEFSAALPDFVQDHLVMEQWYNQMGSPKSGSPVSVDFDHLPDFAVNNLEPDASGRGHGSIINDMPFDLTAAVAGPSCSSSQPRTNRTPLRNTSPNVPLDLPPQNLDFSFDLPRRRTTPPAAAPELPPDLTGNSGAGGYFRGVDNHSPPPAGSAADKIHRLPDFLSDGPIHSSGRLADVTQHDTPHFNSPDAEASHSQQQQQRLQIERQENDRLRRELDDNRRIVAEQARRIAELERALEVAKSSAHRVEGFEENLDKSYLRAATAESQVLSLRQKMKKLTSDMEALRLENEMLKEEGAVGGASSEHAGACGGGPGPSGIRAGGMASSSRRGHSSFSRAQELSRELRQAAASAENNLRQLLTGVDNLRMMASTIENIDRIDITSHPEDFLSDSDDDDLLGPAL